MKKEELAAIGLTDEQADKVFAINGKDIEAVKAKFADYDDVKSQLSDAGKTIADFKAMDIDSIRKAADDWKQKAEQAEKDATAKIADMEFNNRLTSAITGAKGRNAKAVIALLDMDTLRASKNQEADVKAALEAVKKDNGYLFDDGQTPPPYAAGTGTGAVVGKQPGQMTYTELCQFMETNPNATI